MGLAAGQPQGFRHASSLHSQLVQLHALVAIALSCQLIFSAPPDLPAGLKELMVLLLIVSAVLVRLLPPGLWDTAGTVEALVLTDTAVTTGLIYVSGNATPDLYLTYFLIILIATLSTTFIQMLTLSLGICAAYSVALYCGVAQSEALSETHLLRVAILVVMAVFHGAATERVRREVDAREQAEASLKLSEHLQQSQKMEAVGRLAGGLAHDFNNMLTVISGHADLLLMTLDEQHPLRKEAGEIRYAAERAASLTRQMLAFSRKQVLDPKVLNATTVISNLERILTRLLGETITLTIVTEGTPGRIHVDPGQLEHAIINLAMNARDAMPLGGTLTVRIAAVEAAPQHLSTIGPLRPGRYVALSIADTGVGMDQQTQARIFEPFFTTKERGRGTGLGLSTVYGIVKQSGGEIRVDSAPGRGSTFTIYLPRVDAPAEQVSRAPVGRPAPGNETILVAEDEQLLREMIRGMLKSQGYVVLEAQDGAEAVRLATNYNHPIDLLLTDVLMPKMDGRELADQLLKQRQKLRVLFVSGYPDDVIARHRVPGPDGAFLQKPFSYETLTRKVREVLDQGSRIAEVGTGSQCQAAEASS